MPPAQHLSPSNVTRWTAQTVAMGPEILDRMERAVTRVRERLLRATAALNQAGVPYAVVGGNAVASWVATVDEGAVRNTRDVDLLVRRSDLQPSPPPWNGQVLSRTDGPFAGRGQTNLRDSVPA